MFELTVESPGLDAAIDVTDSVADALRSRSVRPGMTHVFLRGSSVALIAMRFEPGTVRDLQEALETLAPVTKSYAHELTTGDRNGFAHVRSALLGTSLSLPWAGDKFAVSDTHRIVLFDFDLKPAVRTLVIDSSQGTGNR